MKLCVIFIVVGSMFNENAPMTTRQMINIITKPKPTSARFRNASDDEDTDARSTSCAASVDTARADMARQYTQFARRGLATQAPAHAKASFVDDQRCARATAGASHAS